jgi:hypothetical protein
VLFFTGRDRSSDSASALSVSPAGVSIGGRW